MCSHAMLMCVTTRGDLSNNGFRRRSVSRVLRTTKSIPGGDHLLICLSSASLPHVVSMRGLSNHQPMTGVLRYCRPRRRSESARALRLIVR